MTPPQALLPSFALTDCAVTDGSRNRTILSGGLGLPPGLAFDAGGDLFAANFFGNSITEFASTGAGTFTPGTVVETGLNGPSFLAFGPSVPAVPEASTTVSLGLLLALGLGGVVVAARRKRRVYPSRLTTPIKPKFGTLPC